MSGLLQRLVGQARGAEIAGTRVRSAMSVHAQVPLGGTGFETSGSPESAIHEADAPGSPPRPIYKSESPPAPLHEPVPAAAVEPPAAKPADSAPPAPLKQVHVERVESNVAPRMRDHGLQLPQPLLAQTPAPALAPMIGAPLADAVRDTGARIRTDALGAPTEVHVHIGRIEVIAAPEAPKKPAPRASRPTVPLAEYLAKKTRS